MLRAFEGKKLTSTLAIFTLLVGGFINLESPAFANTPFSSNAVDYYAQLNGSSTSFKANTSVGPIPTTGPFTVEAWIYQPAGVTGTRTVFSQGGTVPIKLQVGGTGLLAQEIAISFGGSVSRSLIKLPVDRWVHVALAVGSLKHALYLDGNLVFNPDNPAVRNLDGAFFIGRNSANSPTEFWSGRIDQVKVWNGTLGESNIPETMHAWGSTGVSTAHSLIAHYDFNDPSVANGIVFNQANTTRDGFHLNIVGAPEFNDVKTVREANGKVIHSFTRSYLNEVGGWVAPTGVTSLSEVLVVGGGGGGGADGGGGGAGGSGILGAPAAFSAEQIVGVKVGQGGAAGIYSATLQNSPDKGQDSEIKIGGSSFAAPGGNAGGATAGSSGGTSIAPINYTGFTEYLGGAGGNGVSGINQAGTAGAAGATLSNTSSGGLLAQKRFGGGGGGGISTDNGVNTNSITPNLGGVSGGDGGGGAGAKTGSRTLIDEAFPCASNANLIGVSSGGNALPNTGGGGGAGAAYGGDCQGSTNHGYDGQRTNGGFGGAGIVLLSFEMIPRCAYNGVGVLPIQDPRMNQVALTGSGVSGATLRLTPVQPTQAAYYGNSVVLDGFIYYVDRGRGKLSRMNLDGTSATALATLSGVAYLGLTTDTEHIYGHTANGIFRYTPNSGQYINNFIANGNFGGEDSSLAYWFDSDEKKGYLFKTTQSTTDATTYNFEDVYKIPLDSPPASINKTTHLFSKTRLSAATVTAALSWPITVLGNKVIWGDWQNDRVFIKDARNPGNTQFADVQVNITGIQTAVDIRAFAVAAGRLYFTNTSNILSIDLATALQATPGTTLLIGARTEATRSNGTVGGSLGRGLVLTSNCLGAKEFPLVATGTATAATANWSTMPGAGTKRQILQYRTNGGQWVQLLDNTTSKSASLARSALGAGFDGYVEFRISSFEYGVWSDWVNSIPVYVGDPPTVVCNSPMILKYAVVSGSTVSIQLTSSVDPVSISWGDTTPITGPTNVIGSQTFSNTYATGGNYEVRICGTFAGFGGVSQPLLQEVVSWGDTKDLTSLSRGFQGASKLTKVPNTFPPNVTDTTNMFNGAIVLNDPNMVSWDTSKVTTMQNMLQSAHAFNQPIGVWNTSNVTNMSNMFGDTKVFNQPLVTDGTKWDTSKVSNFRGMFSGALAFNQDLSSWDTSSATNMEAMFANAKVFNQPLVTNGSKWDTSKVTTMMWMFKNSPVFNQDISNWNTSSVISMYGMFEGTTVFNKDISNWDTSSVVEFPKMFFKAVGYTHRPPKVISSAKYAQNMLDFSGISDETYSKAIIDWAAAANKPTGLPLGAVDKTALCKIPGTATVPRDELLELVNETNQWVITDKTGRTDGFCTPTVTITAKVTTQVYGSDVPSVGFDVASTYEGADWINEISCSAKLTAGGSPVTTSTVPGTYVTECSGPTGSGIGLAITYVNKTHTITKRPLTIQIQNKIATTGSSRSNPSPATVGTDYLITSGIPLGGDALDVTVSGPTGTLTSGTSALTGSVPSATSNKYDITFENGTLTVSQKRLVVTGKNAFKTYGDSLTLSNTDGWICEGANCATELSGKVSLTSGGLGGTANVGSYQISSAVSDINSSEYDVVNTNGGTVTVLKRALQVTPTAISLQGGSAAPTYGYTITGWVNGDNETVAGFQAPTCSSGYSDKTPRGTTLTITCSGGNPGANYYFVYGTSDLTVLAASALTDLTPSILAPDEETGTALVPFTFDINPYNSICYGTLLITYHYEDGTFEELEPYRLLLDSSRVNIELPLVAGDYSYQLILDGNCYVEPVVRDLRIATASNSSFVVPLNIGPDQLTLTPNQIPAKTSPKAVIEGINLDQVLTIRIGGKNVKILSITKNRIEIQLPKLPKGKYDVIFGLDNRTTMRWEIPLTVGDGVGKATVSKTFASFRAGSSAMTKSIRSGITKFLKANKSKYSTVECVGYTDGPFVRRLDVPLSINRAKVACSLAAKLGYKVVSRSYVNEKVPGSKLRKVKLILGK